jgi:hypothetical protein
MSCFKLNFKREIIVFTLIWLACTFMIFNVFTASPYQGQSKIIFYASLISSSFYPSLFLFAAYLSILSIVDSLLGLMKKAAPPEEKPLEEIPEEPAN